MSYSSSKRSHPIRYIAAMSLYECTKSFPYHHITPGYGDIPPIVPVFSTYQYSVVTRMPRTRHISASSSERRRDRTGQQRVFEVWLSSEKGHLFLYLIVSATFLVHVVCRFSRVICASAQQTNNQPHRTAASPHAFYIIARLGSEHSVNLVGNFEVSPKKLPQIGWGVPIYGRICKH